MSRINVCDFCEEPSFIGTKLSIRGNRRVALPGMFSRIKQKLELCDPCYEEMIVYISKNKGVKNG